MGIERLIPFKDKNHFSLYSDFITLCGDRFVAGSALTGGNPRRIILYLQSFFDNMDTFMAAYFGDNWKPLALSTEHPLFELYEKRHTLPSLLKQSTLLLDIDEKNMDTDGLLERIRQLPQGEGLFLVGGWVANRESVSGHIFLYQFIRVGDEEWEFRVLNTGDGIVGYHQSLLDKTRITATGLGSKRRYYPLTYRIDGSILRAKGIKEQFGAFMRALNAQGKRRSVCKHNPGQAPVSYMYENIIFNIMLLGTADPDQKKRVIKKQYREDDVDLHNLHPLASPQCISPQYAGTCSGEGTKMIVAASLSQLQYHWFTLLFYYGMCEQMVKQIRDMPITTSGDAIQKKESIALVRAVLKELGRLFSQNKIQYPEGYPPSRAHFNKKALHLMSQLDQVEKKLWTKIPRVPQAIPGKGEKKTFKIQGEQDPFLTPNLDNQSKKAKKTLPEILQPYYNEEEKKEEKAPHHLWKKLATIHTQVKGQQEKWEPSTVTDQIEKILFTLVRDPNKETWQFDDPAALEKTVMTLMNTLSHYREYSQLSMGKDTLTPMQFVTTLSMLFLMYKIADANCDKVSYYFVHALPAFLKGFIECNKRYPIHTGSPEHDLCLYHMVKALKDIPNFEEGLNEREGIIPIISKKALSDMRITAENIPYFWGYQDLVERVLDSEQKKQLEACAGPLTEPNNVSIITGKLDFFKPFLHCNQIQNHQDKHEKLDKPVRVAVDTHKGIASFFQEAMHYLIKETGEDKRVLKIGQTGISKYFKVTAPEDTCMTCTASDYPRLKNEIVTFRGKPNKNERWILNLFANLKSPLVDHSLGEGMIPPEVIYYNQGQSDIGHVHKKRKRVLSPGLISSHLVGRQHNIQSAMRKKLLSTRVSPSSQIIATIELFAKDSPEFFLHYAKVLEHNLFDRFLFLRELKQTRAPRVVQVLNQFLTHSTDQYADEADPETFLSAVKLSVFVNHYVLSALAADPDAFKKTGNKIKACAVQAISDIAKKIDKKLRSEEKNKQFPTATLSAYRAMLAAMLLIHDRNDHEKNPIRQKEFLSNQLRYLHGALLRSHDTDAFYCVRQALLRSLFNQKLTWALKALKVSLQPYYTIHDKTECRLTYKTLTVRNKDEVCRLDLETGEKVATRTGRVAAPRTLILNDAFSRYFTDMKVMPKGMLHLDGKAGAFLFTHKDQSYRFVKGEKTAFWKKARLQRVFPLFTTKKNPGWFQLVSKKSESAFYAGWGTALLPLVYRDAKFWQDSRGNVVVTYGDGVPVFYYKHSKHCKHCNNTKHCVHGFTPEGKVYKNSLVKACHPTLSLFENACFVYKRKISNADTPNEFIYTLPRYDLSITFSEQNDLRASAYKEKTPLPCKIKEKEGTVRVGRIARTSHALPFVGFVFDTQEEKKEDTPPNEEAGQYYYVPFQSYDWRAQPHPNNRNPLFPKGHPNGLYPDYLFALTREKNQINNHNINAYLPLHSDHQRRYFVYKLDSEGHPVCDSVEKGLYLVYLYMMEGRYAQANVVLQSLEKIQFRVDISVASMLALFMHNQGSSGVGRHAPPRSLEFVVMRLKVMARLVDALAFSETLPQPKGKSPAPLTELMLIESLKFFYQIYLKIGDSRSINAVYLSRRESLSIATYLYHRIVTSSTLGIRLAQQIYILSKGSRGSVFRKRIKRILAPDNVVVGQQIQPFASGVFSRYLPKASQLALIDQPKKHPNDPNEKRVLKGRIIKEKGGLLTQIEAVEEKRCDEETYAAGMQALICRDGETIYHYLPALFSIKAQGHQAHPEWQKQLVAIMERECQLMCHRTRNVHPVSVVCFLLQFSSMAALKETLSDVAALDFYGEAALCERLLSRVYCQYTFEYTRNKMRDVKNTQIVNKVEDEVVENEDNGLEEKRAPSSLIGLFRDRKTHDPLPCNSAVASVRECLDTTLMTHYRFFDTLSLALKCRDKVALEKAQSALVDMQFPRKDGVSKTLKTVIQAITFADEQHAFLHEISEKKYEKKDIFIKKIHEIFNKLTKEDKQVVKEQVRAMAEDKENKKAPFITETSQWIYDLITEKKTYNDLPTTALSVSTRQLRQYVQQCFAPLHYSEQAIDAHSGRILYDLVKERKALSAKVTVSAFSNALDKENTALKETQKKYKKAIQKIWQAHQQDRDTLRLAGWDAGLVKKAGDKTVSIDWLVTQWQQDDLYTVGTLCGFSSEEKKQLRGWLRSYLTDYVQAQHIARIQSHWKKCDQTQPTTTLSFHCLQALMQDNLCQHNGPLDLLFLYFQSQQNLLVRKEQLEAIRRIVTHEGSGNIQQLLMGGGKSSVILLFVSLLQSKLNHTMMVSCIPKGLLEDNTFSEAYQRLTGKKVHKFLFDRHFKGRLTELRDNLRTVHQEGEALVTCAATLFSLTLKLLELLDGMPVNCKGQEIEALVEIIHLLDNSGFILVDEIHNEFRSNLDLNYGLSAPETIEEGVIDNMSDFLTHFFTFSRKQKQGSTVTPDLVNDYIGYLYAHDAHFRKTLCGGEKTQLKTVQTHLKNPTQETAKWANNLDEKAQSLLRLLVLLTDPHRGLLYKLNTTFEGEQFGFPDHAVYVENLSMEAILKRRLQRPDDPDYDGVLAMVLGNMGQYIAVPYAGANDPKSQSRFADYDRTFLYTAATFFKHGLPKGVFLYCLKKMQETALSHSDKGHYRAHNQHFQRLCGVPDDEKNDYTLQSLDWQNVDMMDQLYRWSSRNPVLISHCLKQYLYPSYRIQAKLLSMNGSRIMGIFKGKIRGMTGTPEGYRTIHQDIVLNRSTGCNGIIKAALLDKDKQKPLRSDMTFEQAKRLTIGDFFKDNPNLRCLIDLAACFKDRSTASLVSEMCDYVKKNQKDIQWVIYFKKVQHDGKTQAIPYARPVDDETGERERRLERLDKTYLKKRLDNAVPGQWFVYLDAAHATGSDLPQPDWASAAVTVRWDTRLSPFYQAVMRMRGLIEKSQTVQLFYARQTEKAPVPGDIASVLKILTDNQKKHQATSHSAAPLDLLVSHEYSDKYRQVMHESDSKKRLSRYQENKNTFFMQAKTSLSNHLLHPSQSVSLSEWYARFSSIIETMPPISVTDMDPILDRAKQNLYVFPDQDRVSGGNRDREVETEKEKEAQVEVEQEVHVKKEHGQGDMPITEFSYKHIYRGRPYTWSMLLSGVPGKTVIQACPFSWEGMHLSPKLMLATRRHEAQFAADLTQQTPPYKIGAYLDKHTQAVKGVLLFPDTDGTLHACFLNGMDMEQLSFLLSSDTSPTKNKKVALLTEKGSLYAGHDFSKEQTHRAFLVDVQRKLAFYNGDMQRLLEMKAPFFTPQSGKGYIEYYKETFYPIRLVRMPKALKMQFALPSALDTLFKTAILHESVDVSTLSLVGIDNSMYKSLVKLEQSLNTFYRHRKTVPYQDKPVQKALKAVNDTLTSFGAQTAVFWKTQFEKLYQTTTGPVYTAIVRGDFYQEEDHLDWRFNGCFDFMTPLTFSHTRFHSAVQLTHAFFNDLSFCFFADRSPRDYLKQQAHQYPAAHEYLHYVGNTLNAYGQFFNQQCELFLKYVLETTRTQNEWNEKIDEIEDAFSKQYSKMEGGKQENRLLTRMIQSFHQYTGVLAAFHDTLQAVSQDTALSLTQKYKKTKKVIGFLVQCDHHDFPDIQPRSDDKQVDRLLVDCVKQPWGNNKNPGPEEDTDHEEREDKQAGVATLFTGCARAFFTQHLVYESDEHTFQAFSSCDPEPMFQYFYDQYTVTNPEEKVAIERGLTHFAQHCQSIAQKNLFGLNTVIRDTQQLASQYPTLTWDTWGNQYPTLKKHGFFSEVNKKQYDSYLKQCRENTALLEEGLLLDYFKIDYKKESLSYAQQIVYALAVNTCRTHLYKAVTRFDTHEEEDTLLPFWQEIRAGMQCLSHQSSDHAPSNKQDNENNEALPNLDVDVQSNPFLVAYFSAFWRQVKADNKKIEDVPTLLSKTRPHFSLPSGFTNAFLSGYLLDEEQVLIALGDQREKEETGMKQRIKNTISSKFSHIIQSIEKHNQYLLNIMNTRDNTVYKKNINSKVFIKNAHVNQATHSPTFCLTFRDRLLGCIKKCDFQTIDSLRLQSGTYWHGVLQEMSTLYNNSWDEAPNLTAPFTAAYLKWLRDNLRIHYREEKELYQNEEQRLACISVTLSDTSSLWSFLQSHFSLEEADKAYFDPFMKKLHQHQAALLQSATTQLRAVFHHQLHPDVKQEETVCTHPVFADFFQNRGQEIRGYFDTSSQDRQALSDITLSEGDNPDQTRCEYVAKKIFQQHILACTNSGKFSITPIFKHDTYWQHVFQDITHAYHTWLSTHLRIAYHNNPTHPPKDEKGVLNCVHVTLDDTADFDGFLADYFSVKPEHASWLKGGINALKDQQAILCERMTQQLRAEFRYALYPNKPISFIEKTHPVIANFFSNTQAVISQQFGLCSDNIKVLGSDSDWEVPDPVGNPEKDWEPMLQYVARRVFQSHLSTQLSTGGWTARPACVNENSAWSHLLQWIQQCTNVEQTLVDCSPPSETYRRQLDTYQAALVDQVTIRLPKKETHTATQLSDTEFEVQWPCIDTSESLPYDVLLKAICNHMGVEVDDPACVPLRQAVKKAHIALQDQVAMALHASIRDFLRYLEANPPSWDAEFNTLCKAFLEAHPVSPWVQSILLHTQTWMKIFNANKMSRRYAQFTVAWYRIRVAYIVFAVLLLGVVTLGALSYMQRLPLPYLGYLSINTTLIVVGASVSLAILVGACCLTLGKSHLFSPFKHGREALLPVLPRVDTTDEDHRLESADMRQVTVEYFSLMEAQGPSTETRADTPAPLTH